MYVVWHDTDYDLALWFHENSLLAEHPDVELRKLPADNSPESIRRILHDAAGRSILPLIRFEMPDLILESFDESKDLADPLLVLEFMTQTPQWQHPSQRFARIYGAALAHVPSGLILPKRKTKLERKGRQGYKDVGYRCSPSVYNAFWRLSNFTKTPALLFHWPDRNGYLRIDETRPNSPRVEEDVSLLFAIVNEAISLGHDPFRWDDSRHGPFSSDHLNNRLALMADEASTPRQERFGTLRENIPTDEFLDKYKLRKVPTWSSVPKRESIVVFAPGGLSPPSSKFRTDPYAGMLCAFDVLFCRAESGNRVKNLALLARGVSATDAQGFAIDVDKDASHVSSPCPFRDPTLAARMTAEQIGDHISEWCPYTSSKQRRIYGQVADIIIFDDGPFWGCA